MPSDPERFEDWKNLSFADPDQAARAFLRKLETIPQSLRKRVFASVTDFISLSDGFANAIERFSKGPLAGVPFLLKDVFDFPGFQTTASSSFLPEIRPYPAKESALSRDLRNHGAVFAGKTHLNEFAYGLSGENKYFGNCPHPVFPERLSGGSSSGSAWAVAKGIVPIATGTDTGGSIRVPAAWCGLYGIRVPPNRWNAEGCFPLSPSFDTAGWFCRTAEDMVTSINALISPERSGRSTIRGVSLLNAAHELDKAYRAKFMDTMERINGNEYAEISEAYRKATRSIAKHYAVLQSIDAYSVHKEWLDAYESRYDPVVWQRIDRARHWLPSEVDAARAAETEISTFFDEVFRTYDFIAMPATQSPAISAADHTDAFRTRLLELTAPGSFARCPILTLPIRLPNAESQGIQLLYASERSDFPIYALNAISTRVPE